MRRSPLAQTLLACAAALALPATTALAQDVFTVTNLGTPPDADITTAVRMNNLGHVAGYSIYYGQGEPSIKPWIWTPAGGFTVLPPPPDMFEGRARAMDVSDSGIVAGDGGFDAGIAWRYENGVYETFGPVGGMPIAYLGAVNEAGNVVGTAKDSQISTEDEVFLNVNGEGTMHLTPGSQGGRGTDINNAGQICGYSQGPLSGFEAFVWDETNGFQFLGTAGLAYSFGYDMNDLGQVVGRAQSASGNTHNSWIYTPGSGQQILPHRGAAAINNAGHVVGTITCCGPDEPWMWTPEGGSTMLFDLVNYVAAGLSGPNSRDINDAGQILLNAYDNNAGGFRPVVLTPVAGATGACCLGDEGDCLNGLTAEQCQAQGGTYAGNGTECTSCVPVGACCLSDGDCLPFQSLADCEGQFGTWQGDGTSCGNAFCEAGLPNDDCADAAPIDLGDTPFTTIGATTDGPAVPCTSAFWQDVWYLYEPDGDGTLTIDTCSEADFDTQLAAYTGTCDDLLLLGCNDDGCFLKSVIDVGVSCGEPVRIRVGGFSTQTGSGTLSLSFDGEPCPAACMGDVDGNQIVDVDDLVNVILEWGSAGASAADVTGDGRVNVDDIVAVILNWGRC